MGSAGGAGQPIIKIRSCTTFHVQDCVHAWLHVLSGSILLDKQGYDSLCFAFVLAWQARAMSLGLDLLLGCY